MFNFSYTKAMKKKTEANGSVDIMHQAEISEDICEELGIICCFA